MYNGIICINKEKDFTSFDVCAKLRGILRQKKIGHTGTLDPMACGVLIVCLGQGTKIASMITSKSKEYEAVMLLGKNTDTEDITGEVISSASNSALSNLTENEVKETINSFLGKYDQIPPMYSAIKKNGKKLYEYAREGKVIEREPRPVEIYDIDIKEVKLPYVTFSVKCSKGTYIRSLCRDIGEKLGVGACLYSLLRREVNGYTLSDALTLSEVEEHVKNGDISDYIHPIDSLLGGMSIACIKDEYLKYLINGNKLPKEAFIFESENDNNNFIRVYIDSELKAIYEYDEALDVYRVYKMF